MAEYIEREALMAQLEKRREYLFKENGDYDHYSNGFDEAVDKVENFTTIEAEPVRHGRWIDGADSFGAERGKFRVCSWCNTCFPRDDEIVPPAYWQGCPNCRAKMDVTDINVGNKDGGADNG